MTDPSLSRLAQEFAAEISNHDWSDAPYRLDRAGHDREADHTTGRVLSESETQAVITNVMWVTAQVLWHADPNFDVNAFATACGVPRSITHKKGGTLSGGITAGIRQRDGIVCTPGTWETTPAT